MMDLLLGMLPPLEDILRYILASGGIPVSILGEEAMTALAIPLMLLGFALKTGVMISRNMVLLMSSSGLSLMMVIVGRWCIFEKAGRSGIPALIPVASSYMEYAVGWKGSSFLIRWLFALLTPVAPVWMIIRYFESGMTKTLAPTVGMAIGLLCAFLFFWYGVVQNYKLSRAFGHSFFFMLGLIFFRPLFLLILGLDSSSYQLGRKEDAQKQGDNPETWVCVGCGRTNAQDAQICAECGFGRMRKR